MPSARASIRGAALKARLAVNGIQKCSRVVACTDGFSSFIERSYGNGRNEVKKVSSAWDPTPPSPPSATN
jgi:hypothetical protein